MCECVCIQCPAFHPEHQGPIPPHAQCSWDRLIHCDPGHERQVTEWWCHTEWLNHPKQFKIPRKCSSLFYHTRTGSWTEKSIQSLEMASFCYHENNSSNPTIETQLNYIRAIETLLLCTDAEGFDVRWWDMFCSLGKSIECCCDILAKKAKKKKNGFGSGLNWGFLP